MVSGYFQWKDKMKKPLRTVDIVVQFNGGVALEFSEYHRGRTGGYTGRSVRWTTHIGKAENIVMLTDWAREFSATGKVPLQAMLVASH